MENTIDIELLRELLGEIACDIESEANKLIRLSEKVNQYTNILTRLERREL